MDTIEFPLLLRGFFMDEAMRPIFEQALAEYLFEEVRKEKKLSIDALASKVWPDQAVESSRMKIHRFLKPQGNGKPKNMYIFDFIRFCEALEIHPITAMVRILDKVESEVKKK